MRRPRLVLALLAVAAAVASVIVVVTAPTSNPTPADAVWGRDMPRTQAAIDLALIAAAALLAGAATLVPVARRRLIGATAVFIVCAVVLYFSSVIAWRLHAPASAGNLGATSGRVPENRLILLGQSIGGIHLYESRRRVEKAFGPGVSLRPGVVSYFGGRLIVDYSFHDRLTTGVNGIETNWSGFHTRSGVRVGSTQQTLRALHVACGYGDCSLAAGPMPDASGTVFTMRHGKVAQIDVFSG